MIRTAILIDGSFYLKRYHYLFKNATDYDRFNVSQAIDVLQCLIHKHLKSDRSIAHYRTFYYDCPPLAKRILNPVSRNPVNLGNSDIFRFRTELLESLKSQRKLALRLGHVKDNGGWLINSKLTKKLISRTMEIGDLTEDSVIYQIQQKGVDMRIGLDISSLAYKKLVDRIILIAGDSDFVPAAKVARREGIDFILDPMWNPIDPSLNEHIDGLTSTAPKSCPEKIAQFLS